MIPVADAQIPLVEVPVHNRKFVSVEPPLLIPALGSLHPAVFRRVAPPSEYKGTIYALQD